MKKKEMIQRINKFLHYNRQDIVFIFLLLGISILYLIPLLSPGFILGHDSEVQLASAAARIKAIYDGQFPIRWAGDLNYGYGNPSFIFYYSLGGYLISLLYFLKLSLETSYELLLSFSFVLAPLFFYIWVKQAFKKEAAFIGALFYGLSPYLFLDVYVRAHLGESMSLVFIPLVFYFIERNLKKVSIPMIVLGGVSYALLIHSHGILSFMFSFLFVSYILFRSRFKLKQVFMSSLILVLGLWLSVYFWLPSILEGKYINSKLFLSNWYQGHFINIKHVIYSVWGFGSNINEPGGLSAQIGPIHSLFIILSIWLIFRNVKLRNILIFWLSAFLVGIFMSTEFSSIFWHKFHILQRFQFPWRFISLSSFSASVLITYFFSVYKSKYIKILAVSGLIILSIPMIRVPRSHSFGDDHYFNYPGTTSFHNEATTIWVAGDAFEYPKKRIDIISGKGEILNLIHKSQMHTFSVDAVSKLKILDNTTYFPGWRAEVDSEKVPIEFQDNNHKGLITFDVPKGKHDVRVIFGESPLRLFADIISLAGVITTVFLLISKKWIKRYLKI